MGQLKIKNCSENRLNAYSGGGRGILASLLSDSIVSGQCLMSIMITYFCNDKKVLVIEALLIKQYHSFFDL
jgi:hypothetical protein